MQLSRKIFIRMVVMTDYLASTSAVKMNFGLMSSLILYSFINSTDSVATINDLITITNYKYIMI